MEPSADHHTGIKDGRHIKMLTTEQNGRILNDYPAQFEEVRWQNYEFDKRRGEDAVKERFVFP